MGLDMVRAVLAAGHGVVAAGRDAAEIRCTLGDDDALLVVSLDVTNRQQCSDAVGAAVARFGRVDVLVNNAGISVKGFFEETAPDAVERQLATNLLGPMNVTRAMLPVMRGQRAGHVIAISSGAGLVGFAFSSVYAASKFGLEGWMDALGREVEPFGIHTTVVNPGFFRTELLTERSASYAEGSIDDYAERRTEQTSWWAGQDGRQTGDPAKLAQALLTIANESPPPRRFIAGADVIALAEQRIAELQAQIAAHRALSMSLMVDA